MGEPLVIAGVGDVVAMIPYLVGAQPENSLVVFPVDHEPPRPIARMDIPANADEHRAMATHLADWYAPFAGGKVMVIAFTDQLERARSICQAVSVELEPDSTVIGQVGAQGDNWVQLDTGESGAITQAARDRVAVAFIGAGMPMPCDSMSQLRASFAPAGNDLSEAVAAATPAAQKAATDPALSAVEERWMSHTIARFVATGQPLDNDSAARLISDVQPIPLRDHAFEQMTRPDAHAHATLWKDLMTRCPEPERAPLATLAAFGYWLSGEGMHAHFALDQIPDHQMSKMAQVVRTLVDTGANPQGWAPPERAERPTDGRGDASKAGHDPRRDPPPATGRNVQGPPR